MESNGRLLLKRQPKTHSLLWSTVGYSLLLMISFAIAASNMDPKSLSGMTKEEKKNLLRGKNIQYSLNRFSSNFPNGPVVIGVYQSGNGSFYHQFKGIAESYASISNIQFAMVNINIPDEKSVFENLQNRKMYQDFSLDDVPAVMFFYNGIEIEKMRMSLRFTNLGDVEIKKRVEGLINYTMQPNSKP